METNQTISIITAALQILAMLSTWFLAYKYIRLTRSKEDEFYTDYVRGNLILRIYKPEFEYIAIGGVPRDKLLDQGTFSLYYMWALIER